ncbi:uncharacterized protein C11orf97 homolog [Pyxicephalus adspersus]
MRRQPRSRIHGNNVTLWNVTSDEEIVNEQEEVETSTLDDVPLRKRFFYVGTPKRIQEITEEERFLQKDEIQVPAVMQLDRILKSEKTMRSFNPAALPRNSFLTQPDNYSRHRGIGGPTRVSYDVTSLQKKDGANSMRWPQKPLTNQPRACISRDPEDVPHL